MPLLVPQKGETQAEFVSRFVKNPTSIKEFPDQKQRLAVGFSQWRKHHGEKSISKEDQINSHYWIVKEMVRRGLTHESQDDLDQETDDLLKQLSEEAAPGLHQDIVDPDLAHLREELISLTIDRIIGLSDEQLQEYHHQAGLVLVERDKQRVQELLEGEMRRRGLLEDTEKKEEPVIKAYSLEEGLSEGQRKTIQKELEQILPLPIYKQTKRLAGLWKSYHLGLKILDEPGKIDPTSPVSMGFGLDRLVVLQKEKKETPKVFGDLAEAQKSLATFEITKVVGEERMVYGPVLIPEIKDGQEDLVSLLEIRNALWKYMDQHGVVGFMHNVQKTVEGINGQVERAIAVGYTVKQLYTGVPSDSMVPGIAEILAHPRTFTNKFRIREIYQAPVSFTLNNYPVRKGTWVMGVYIVDDLIWEHIKSGKLTGFSIGGESERIPI